MISNKVEEALLRNTVSPEVLCPNVDCRVSDAEENLEEKEAYEEAADGEKFQGDVDNEVADEQRARNRRRQKAQEASKEDALSALSPPPPPGRGRCRRCQGSSVLPTAHLDDTLPTPLLLTEGRRDLRCFL